MQLRKLAENLESIFRWFDSERRMAYPALTKVIADTWYEKAIIRLIDEVLDESGSVRDNASEELANIRMGLFRKREMSCEECSTGYCPNCTNRAMLPISKKAF